MGENFCCMGENFLHGEMICVWRKHLLHENISCRKNFLHVVKTFLHVEKIFCM